MAPVVPPVQASSALVKKPRGTIGQQLQFKTNVYPLSLQKKIPYFKHDIRIRIVHKNAKGNETTSELTNSSRFFDDDTRKRANVNVLHALSKKEPFAKKSLIYDRAAILFTVEEIIKKGQEEVTVSLPRPSLGTDEAFDSVKEVIVTVKKATDRYQITSDDYNAAAGADFIEGPDKSIFELLNIATSQCVVDFSDECAADSKSRIYILNPGAYSLQEERDIGDGQILRTSLKKSVKTIENVLKDGKVVNPIAAIIVDVSRTAMHRPELLSSKMTNSRSPLSTLLGLKVKKIYGNREILTVTGFTNESVAQCSVVIGDETMRMTEYLKRQYGISLRSTNLAGVKDRKGNTFAPELLTVLPQMVKPEQNTPNTSRNVILANATPGEERMATIESLTSALHLEGDKAKSMGVMLQRNTTALKVAGRMLPSKKLKFGKEETTMGFQRGERAAFLPGKLDAWAFFSVSRYDYSGHMPTLIKKAQSLGMSASKPIVVRDGLVLGTIREAIGDAKRAGCTFVFIVSDFDNDHIIIKSAEREFGILTQQMRGRSTEKLAADTGSNVALKINIKNGGINHVVGDEKLFLEPQLLIMSLVFDHPSSMTKKEMEEGVRPTCPAVIGISSNAAVLKGKDGKILPESCQNFVEKFAYANPREWKQDGEPTFKDTVFDLMRHEVEAFKNARGKPAQKIIVYVSGVPEAERGYWAKEGKSLVVDVCHTFSQAYNPGMTIITMSTEGCERFVAEGKPANVKGPDPRIGLVIDSVVVNPKVNEWFLQSAKALKGTPRTIKYTLVAEPASDAAKHTMDQLQGLTWSLAHLHQHCCGTIGFPSPSRIAADAAKRARDLFKYRQQVTRNRGPYNLEELNSALGYKCDKVSSTTRSV